MRKFLLLATALVPLAAQAQNRLDSSGLRLNGKYVASWPVGALVGTSDAQTLTSKILSGATINSGSTMSASAISSSTITTGTMTSSTIDSTPIGGTTPAAGAFTNLSSSGTVSGTGFDTYISGKLQIALPSSTNIQLYGGTGSGTGIAGVARAIILGTNVTIASGILNVTNTSSLPSATTSQLYGGSGAAGTANVVGLDSNLTISAGTLTLGLTAPPAIGGSTPNSGAFTTLSASSTVSGTGFSTYLASPPAIGGTIAAAGSFANLSSSGTVSGTGFSNYLASPPGIGGTVAAAGKFTTLAASSTVSGTGFSTYLASPPAIGGTAAAGGSFTTLSASSTVSGTGFSTYFASPPAIGGTAANTGAFTTLSASSTVSGSGFSTYLASPPAIGGSVPAVATFTGLTTTNIYTPSTTKGIVGTTLGDDAQAGSDGEWKVFSLLQGSAVSLSTSVVTDIMTVSLTAGDWQCWGEVDFYPAGTTQPLHLEVAIGDTANTLPTPGQSAFSSLNNLFVTLQTGANVSMPIAPTRVNVTGTTTVHLIVFAAFSVSTMTAGGKVECRRWR